MESHQISRDAGYEWKAVLLLSLGFGLVGVDRFMIMPLFPTIMGELKLGYGALGLITGVLAFAWGAAALLMGSLSDRIGRRKVIIGSLVAFSLLVGASGLAAGLGGLLLVRAVMGFADGAYTPTSIGATVDASKPSRRGFNVGLQQMMLPLFGLALAPLIVTQLLQVMEWRWIFLLLTLPGLVVALLMYRVLRDQPAMGETGDAHVSTAGWREVLRHRNPPLLILGMLCWLTCLIVTSALLPSYLTAHLKLGTVQMGYVMSAIGFGATAGCLVLPAVSDKVGRKPVMILSAIATFVFLWLLSRVGAHQGQLFALLFLTHFFNFSLITLTVGPLSAESVPASLMATSSGLVIGIGEIFGGGAAPILAGFVAERFGIENVLSVALAGLGVGIVSTLLLAETAPGVRGRQVVAKT